MIGFMSKAGWMRFPSLSVSAGLTSTFALAYRLTDDGSEKWTARFNRFKARDTKAYYGGARLFYASFPPLLEALGLDPSECTLISALSSSETKASPERQIPYIASQLAAQVGAHEACGELAKQVHNKLHSLYRADAREAELDKANYTCGSLPGRNVFIFDDFVTRGSTLSRVAQSVLASNPKARVFGVALAKTERIAYCPHPDNGHVPAQWDKVWTDGEKEVA